MSERIGRASHHGLQVYLGGLACGALAVLATPTALLAAALLLPTLLALFTEHAPGRPLARCMALFGLAGALPALATLWRGPGGLEVAFAQAGDLGVLSPAWAVQAASWLLAEALPLAGKFAIDFATAARERRLRAERTRIVQEWSLEGKQEQSGG